jgi:hypothetical protein
MLSLTIRSDMCEHLRDKVRRTITPPRKVWERPVPRPFRLLDLPKELRLVIYEQLDITTKQHIIPIDKKGEHTITMVSLSVPVRILATCRFVSEEAGVILKPKIKQLLKTPPTIMVGVKHLVGLTPMELCSSYHRTFIGNLFQAIRSPYTLEAIHRYRKNICGSKCLRALTLWFEHLSTSALKGLTSFILRAVEFKKSGYDTPNVYPPIAIAIDISEPLVQFHIAIKTSRAKRLYAKYIHRESWPRIARRQVGTMTLMSHFAIYILATCNMWKTMSVCVMVHFSNPEAASSCFETLESTFETRLRIGMLRASIYGNGGMLNYGGLYKGEANVKGE